MDYGGLNEINFTFLEILMPSFEVFPLAELTKASPESEGKRNLNTLEETPA